MSHWLPLLQTQQPSAGDLLHLAVTVHNSPQTLFAAAPLFLNMQKGGREVFRKGAGLGQSAPTGWSPGGLQPGAQNL